jgi:hypothetical protein
MASIAVLAAVALCLSGLTQAQYADQDEPQHGGVTNWNTNSEYSFELVVDGATATVYVEDHEVPVPTSGAKGTLSVTRNDVTKSAELVPSGENRMTARGLAIGKGDRVVARITLADGIVAMVGRFIAR